MLLSLMFYLLLLHYSIHYTHITTNSALYKRRVVYVVCCIVARETSSIIGTLIPAGSIQQVNWLFVYYHMQTLQLACINN